MDTFHTSYKLDTEFEQGLRGLTFKKQMIPTSTKFKEMTICFRIKMDFFTIIGDYIPLFELLDGGGWENGVLVFGSGKEPAQETVEVKRVLEIVQLHDGVMS